MKSIGELKSLNPDRCSFEDIFDEYEDIMGIERCLDDYLFQFISQDSECIMCGNEINKLGNAIRGGDCAVCGYPGRRKHTIECDGEEYHFSTLVLQFHPSELRG